MDSLVLVLYEGLLHDAHVLVELFQAPFDDAIDDPFRLALFQGFSPIVGLFLFNDLLRNVIAGKILRGGESDVERQVVGQSLELVCLGDKVGLAV